MADNYINPHNTPIDVHSDVAACLQDILLAEKGEEVRGTIFDAIQLMDGRTTALQTWLNENTEEYITEHFGQLIDEAIGTIYLSFECQTGDNLATCNMTAFEIEQAMMIGEKKILASVHYSGPTRYGLMTLHPAGSASSSYIVTIRSIYNNNVEKFSFTFHCNEPEEYITYSYETVAIGGGGGGTSYTAGAGIDIDSNNVINTVRIKIAHLDVTSTPTINYTWTEIYNLLNTYGSATCYLWYSHGNLMHDSAIGYYTLTNSGITIRFTCLYDNTIEYRKYYLSSANVLTMEDRIVTDYQKKLTSANAGTGISITNDAQGNPVISLDLPQAEGGGF